MSKRPDGGPAFPTVETSVHGGQRVTWGMSLRDYFAAHAPQVQPWFSPMMESPEPELPGTRPIYRGSDYPAAAQAESKRLCDEYDALLDQRDEWRAEQQRQTYIQWPYAWADAVIAQRERTVDEPTSPVPSQETSNRGQVE